MSRLFSSPKAPKLPAQQAEPEPVETVTEDATEAGRRRRRKLVAGGAPSTRISGIRSALFAALKKRLGE
jgi:hypothetical protein